ncbi:MAG: NfeD family protein [Bacilli bacterium]|nr:NfeD family protein [Bacilli bacterium]
MAFFWLGLFVVLLIIEICTINLVSIWFAIGAFVSFFVSMFTENIFIQGSVFLVVSLLTLLVTKPFIKKMKFQNVRTNLDRVVGMEGVVTEEISKFEIGEVKVDGKRWSAKSDSSISVGDVVEIERIDGVKLIVKKKES